jgi:hypothetical protein
MFRHIRAANSGKIRSSRYRTRFSSLAHMLRSVKTWCLMDMSCVAAMSSACAMLVESSRAAADFVVQGCLVTHALKVELVHFISNALFCTQNMDTLDNTEWDVLIVGTGLQQSLLALYVYRNT